MLPGTVWLPGVISSLILPGCVRLEVLVIFFSVPMRPVGYSPFRARGTLPCWARCGFDVPKIMYAPKDGLPRAPAPLAGYFHWPPHGGVGVGGIILRVRAACDEDLPSRKFCMLPGKVWLPGVISGPCLPGYGMDGGVGDFLSRPRVACAADSTSRKFCMIQGTVWLTGDIPWQSLPGYGMDGVLVTFLSCACAVLLQPCRACGVVAPCTCRGCCGFAVPKIR